MQEDMDNMQVLPPANEDMKLRQKNRDKLPKFTLRRGERFYISREQLQALNDSFYQLLEDMDAGNSLMSEDLRSYMESVVFVSYVNEIEKLQRENYLEKEVERERVETLNFALTPRRWRNWYWLFRLNRNQSAILLDELVSRQARAYYYKKESELPTSEEAEEAEFDPYEVQIETLKAFLPRMRKKKRILLEGIISGLAASYGGKEARVQRLKEELQAEKDKAEQLTSELKREAVKRLVECLNAVKQTKQPADWEILRLRQSLEEAKPDEEPPEEDENEYEDWSGFEEDKEPPEEDEFE